MDEGLQTLSLEPHPHQREAANTDAVVTFLTADGVTYALLHDRLQRRDSTGAWRNVIAPQPAALTDSNISALAFDDDNNLWVGYFDRGLDILRSDRTQHVEDSHVFCVNRLALDPTRRTVAVATANGLVLFDRDGKPRQTLTRHDGLIADHVTDVVFRPNGMTLATPAGLTFLDAGQQPQSLYGFQGLVNNHVYALALQPDGATLAGTLGGLSLLRQESVERNLTVANSGLKHNWITAITPDKQGGLERRNLRRGRHAHRPQRQRPGAHSRVCRQPKRHAPHRHPPLRRLARWRPLDANPRHRPVDQHHRRPALRKRHSSRRPQRHPLRRHRKRPRQNRRTERAPMNSSRATPPRFSALSAFSAFVLLFLSLVPTTSRADAGVLIPGNKEKPDASLLSLQEMRVDVLIDNGDARVRIVQIFASHTAHMQEGTYQFTLPDGSTVSDFAVWDGPVRIPAVVLERKRAEEIYDQATAQAIDPGLLEMGERTDDPATTTAIFTAKISPIPAYGTKRLEIEYHQRLSINNFKQLFLLSLKPDAYQKQIARHFSLHFEVKSAHALKDFELVSKLFPLKMSVAEAHHGVGAFEADNLSLDEDFVARWKLDPAEADTLAVTTYRSQRQSLPQPDESHPPAPTTEPGFFQADLLVGDSKSANTSTDSGPARTVIVLFDNSLSMQWEKLERSYAALQGVLATLRPIDRFNILLFNQDVTPWKPAPVAADASSVNAAREAVRSSKLRGGTDLGKALAAGLKQCDANNSILVVLTDGGSDRGASILPAKIVSAYAKAWTAALHRPKTDIFAVGNDAKVDLLALLARYDGTLEHVLSTEPVDYKLESFLSKLARSPVAGLKLDAPKTTMVYPLDDSVFTGSMATWVGTYAQPAGKVAFTATGSRSGEAFAAKSTVDLPATAEDHTQLPRLWAQARVHALLLQIDEEGETRAAIDEIIRLSRKYKFVTPYTSFLAVPRSLLRPRVIRPGDPVLRVRTDEAIESVIALFPFGLTKALRHLPDEDTRGRRRRTPVGDTLPSPRRHEGRHLLGPPHPARHARQHLPRRKDLRHRQHSTGRQSPSVQQANAPRRNRHPQGQRHANHAHALRAPERRRL